MAGSVLQNLVRVEVLCVVNRDGVYTRHVKHDLNIDIHEGVFPLGFFKYLRLPVNSNNRNYNKTIIKTILGTCGPQIYSGPK